METRVLLYLGCVKSGIVRRSFGSEVGCLSGHGAFDGDCLVDVAGIRDGGLSEV